MKYLQMTEISLLALLLAVTVSAAAKQDRPFWTEKSSYKANGKVYFVGVASNSPSLEAGRLAAFKHAQRQLALYLGYSQDQLLDGVSLDTQMTFDEPIDNGYQVWRLTYVEESKLEDARPREAFTRPAEPRKPASEVPQRRPEQKCFGKLEGRELIIHCTPDFNGTAKRAVIERLSNPFLNRLTHVCMSWPHITMNGYVGDLSQCTQY